MPASPFSCPPARKPLRHKGLRAIFALGLHGIGFCTQGLFFEKVKTGLTGPWASGRPLGGIGYPKQALARRRALYGPLNGMWL